MKTAWFARQTQLARWSMAADPATPAQAMHDLYPWDLRADIGRMQRPVLVLGAWAASAHKKAPNHTI